VLGVADRHAARAGDPRRTAQQLDSLALEPGGLARVLVVGDHEVAPLEGGRRVERSGHGLARAGRLAGGLDGLARAQQRLRRDAGVVVAFAADQIALHDRDPQAAVGQVSGAVLAGRARPDHDDVEIAHASPFRASSIA
jgi:hypothetical protein